MCKTLIHLLAPLLLAGVPALVNGQDCSSEKSHEFDFWIGEWEVTANGKAAGTNTIEPILNGCVLQENWNGVGGSGGSSFNFYNPREESWEQFWVWRNGTTLHLKGVYANGRMILQGESMSKDGEPVTNRITWYDNADGTVRQHWEISSDGGVTWTTAFDGLYSRKN
jgi:hypothetical protein